MAKFVKKRRRRAPPSMAKTTVREKLPLKVLTYNEDAYRDFSIDNLDTLAINPTEVTWLRFDQQLTPLQLQQIGKRFNIDAMYISDAINVEHFSKPEILDNGIFVIIKYLSFENGNLQFGHIAIFVVGSVLITIADKNDANFEIIGRRIIENTGRIRRKGVDYLLFSILDSYIDSYYTVMEQFSNGVEALEAEVTVNHSREVLAKINLYKVQSLYLQKLLLPIRDTYKKLSSKNYPIIQVENEIYFNDLSDHMFQLTDSLSSYRSMLADLLTVYTSYVTLKTNRVMRFLTVLSTVFIPPTFIVGWYGMNFTSMPEFNWRFGQLLALSLVALSVVITLWQIRKKINHS